jgi:hypothetical protein
MIFQQATEAKKGTGGFCPALLTDGSALASGAAARAGATTTLAAAGDLAAVMVFETATLPSWARWFHAGKGTPYSPRVRGPAPRARRWR